MKKEQALTKIEFQAYLLLYAATLDGQITKEEVKVILSGIDSANLVTIYEQFCEENDFAHIETISQHKALYMQTEAETQYFINEMKKVFLADKKLSPIENTILHSIQKI